METTTNTRQSNRTARRQVKASTTLNRKYVKRPAAITTSHTSGTTQAQSGGRSIKITHFSSDRLESNQTNKKTITVTDKSEVRPAEAHPTQVRAQEKMRARQSVSARTQAPKLTAKQLKEQAIKKALAAAERQTTSVSLGEQIAKSGKTKKEKRLKFGLGRVMLAFSCTAAVIFGIVYFVNLNMPDIQFRAVAMQLNATYPSYLPYNYAPTEISSENNIITINFKKKGGDESFTITEERSSWDSNALLNNYIKEKYGEDYTILREQGLTIYVSNNNAAWVNGGIVYKLETKKGPLSKKQISDIAVSF